MRSGALFSAARNAKKQTLPKTAPPSIPFHEAAQFAASCRLKRAGLCDGCAQVKPASATAAAVGLSAAIDDDSVPFDAVTPGGEEVTVCASNMDCSPRNGPDHLGYLSRRAV